MKYISVEILKHKTHKSVYHTRRHTHIRVLGSVTTDHLCLFHEHLCFNITSAEDLNTWLLESLIIKPSGSRFQMFPENVFFFFFTNKVVTKCLNKKKKVFSTTFKLFLTFNNFILVQISKDELSILCQATGFHDWPVEVQVYTLVFVHCLRQSSF